MYYYVKVDFTKDGNNHLCSSRLIVNPLALITRNKGGEVINKKFSRKLNEENNCFNKDFNFLDEIEREQK